MQCWKVTRTPLVATMSLGLGAACLAQVIFCSEPSLGSWGQYIKQSELATGWLDDAPDQMQALADTSQDFVICDVDLATDWEVLEEMLDEAEAAGVQVFAALTAPHLGGGNSIWFGEEAPELGSFADEYPRPVLDCDDKTTAEELVVCERAWILEWLEGWTRAAATLAEIAADHPALVGLTINDFDGYVESPDYPHQVYGRRLTHDEVEQIYDACHSFDMGNRRFEFWPTIYHGSTSRLVAPGHILGVNYGVELWDGNDGPNCAAVGDSMSVTLEFDVSIPTLLFFAELRFFHRDSREGCTPFDVYKRIYLNGVDLSAPESVAGDQGVQHERISLSGLLIPDSVNTITFELDPESMNVCCEDRCSVHNGCGGTGVWWQIWGVTMHFAEPGYPESIEPVDAEYITFTDPGEYMITAGCPPRVDDGDIMISNNEYRAPWLDPADQLPDDAVNGRIARRLIAAPCTAYLIRDVLDGIVVPYYEMRRSPTQNCGGVMVPSFDYDADDYAALLEQLKLDLAGAKLMALHLGHPLVDTDYNLDVFDSQMEVGAIVADRSGLWSMPLGVHFLDEQRGVFAERDSDSTSYQFLAYYPGRQTRLEGWFQEFEIDPWTAVSGDTASIRLYDNYTGDANRFTKIVAGGVAPYMDSAAGDEGEALVELERPDVVTVRLEVATDDFGHSPIFMYFRVEDASNTPVVIDAADYEYRTGVDPFIEEIYQSQAEKCIVMGLTLGERGDINGNGIIGFADLNILLGSFGDTGPGLPADLNRDGVVSFPDLNIMLSSFSATCIEPGG